LYLEYFLLGIAFAIGVCVTSNYALELVPSRHKVCTSTLFHASHAIPPLLAPLIIKSTGQTFEYEMIGLCLIGLSTLVVALKIPESPKYLYFKGNFKGCEDALN
jgi:hypothetical protein